jgi:tRNA 2-thiouridine synthesizing protein A
MSITLDLKGLKCPLPALRTRKALKSMGPGEAISVVCTDPLARIDIPNLLAQTGDVLDGIEQAGEVFVFRIRKRLSTP